MHCSVRPMTPVGAERASPEHSAQLGPLSLYSAKYRGRNCMLLGLKFSLLTQAWCQECSQLSQPVLYAITHSLMTSCMQAYTSYMRLSNILKWSFEIKCTERSSFLNQQAIGREIKPRIYSRRLKCCVRRNVRFDVIHPGAVLM